MSLQDLLIISAWASALLVPAGRAMRRPQSVGRVTGTGSRALFLYVCAREKAIILNNSVRQREPRAQKNIFLL